MDCPAICYDNSEFTIMQSIHPYRVCTAFRRILAGKYRVSSQSPKIVSPIRIENAFPDAAHSAPCTRVLFFRTIWLGSLVGANQEIHTNWM